MATFSILFEEAGKSPVTFRFSMLDLAAEDDYAEWVREQYITEAVKSCASLPTELRASVLAEISMRASLSACGLTGELGLQKGITVSGIIKVLQLASKPNHPPTGIPTDVLKTLILIKSAEIAQLIMDVLPYPDEIKANIFAKRIEKKAKVDGAVDGLFAAPSTSNGFSPQNLSVLDPKRLEK